MKTIISDLSISQSYNFTEPSRKFTLNKVLKEISGLEYCFNRLSLFAVNDEKGKLFELNPNNGEILNTYSFAGKGDYEGLTIINGLFVAVKSNGELYVFDTDTEETTNVSTPFTQHNDVEGICYYQHRDTILLACKGDSLSNENDDNKTIYSFKFETKTLDNKPFLIIENSDLLSFLAKKSKQDYSDKEFNKLKKRITEFAPSAISIHPQTESVFIASARGSLVVVFNKNKELTDIVFLNEQKIKQPEGISFDEDNNLFVSTEGQNRKAKIFVFDCLC